jgi:hypothetical protein
MKKITTLIIAILITLTTNGQTPIDVYESTIKISGIGEESYMCGLAEGDQLIFNFQEINGKDLKEVEIIEYPSTSKYLDYKTKKIENKTINITRTSIYKFRFANSSLGGRVCKFKIQRIPASEQTKNFNTSVYFKTFNDTTITNITDQVSKVHSTMNSSGNRTILNFTLPLNTVAWSYYIGVDQGGQENFNNAAKELASKATPLFSSIPGFGPLAALALGGTSYLSQLQSGEDIDYAFTDNINANLFQNGKSFRHFKSGKVINDFSRMTAPNQGTIFICLSNDNAVTGVTVTVKITAISVSTREEPYLKE